MSTISDAEPALARGPVPLTPGASPAGAERLDALERSIHTLDGAQLRDLTTYRDVIFHERFRGPHIYDFLWPSSWYIPAGADSHAYSTGTAPADHRYQFDWENSRNGQPAGSAASRDTGQLFAWCNVSDLSPGYTGYAGVAARVTPTASLSYVELGAEIDLQAQTRWWVMPKGPTATLNVTYQGTVYLAAWELDPVSSTWELLRPFASRSIFSFNDYGSGYTPILTTQAAFSDLHTTVQLQNGRSYAFGVSFEVTMGHTIHDSSGNPYVRQSLDEFKLWCSLQGVVPKLTARTTKVLVP